MTLMVLKAPYIFTDTETTGLVEPYLPDGRRIWEIGVRRREIDYRERTLHLFISLEDLGLWEMLPPEVRQDGALPVAERLRMLPEPVLEALNVGRFFQRHPQVAPGAAGTVLSERLAASVLVEDAWLTPEPGSSVRPQMLGCVPDFEHLGYADMLRRHGHIGAETPWHYQRVDVEVYAAARLGALPPFDCEEIMRGLGLDPDAYDRHTAMGDAMWTRDLFDVAVLDAARARSLQAEGR